MKAQELKIKYNAILERQDKALKWFESEDFNKKFNSVYFIGVDGNKIAGGASFFELTAIKYKRLEVVRIKILNELDKLQVKYTVGNIIHGFDI